MTLISNAMVDVTAKGASPYTKFQFERLGFFSVDPDTTNDQVYLTGNCPPFFCINISLITSPALFPLPSFTALFISFTFLSFSSALNHLKRINKLLVTSLNVCINKALLQIDSIPVGMFYISYNTGACVILSQ